MAVSVGHVIHVAVVVSVDNAPGANVQQAKQVHLACTKT